ncbi:hypothetical protein shn_25185 (plasmid) [Shinella sp. HZN7]|nr:hypothetical protein shn_25185 [Shinella sp. HZN7]
MMGRCTIYPIKDERCTMLTTADRRTITLSIADRNGAPWRRRAGETRETAPGAFVVADALRLMRFRPAFGKGDRA